MRYEACLLSVYLPVCLSQQRANSRKFARCVSMPGLLMFRTDKGKDVALAVARGLYFMHQNGVIHRHRVQLTAQRHTCSHRSRPVGAVSLAACASCRPASLSEHRRSMSACPLSGA